MEVGVFRVSSAAMSWFYIALAWTALSAEEPQAAHSIVSASQERPVTVDVIRLTNGNKIVGRVVHTFNGMAEIEVPGVGEIEIPVANIAAITKESYMPPREPSPEEKRAQEERLAQQRQEFQEEYRRYLERRFRQQVFDEERRRQLQLEADWREFVNRSNLNRRFQEDLFFLRFGSLFVRGSGCSRWGQFAPWTH